jgi:hypothetical protein
MEASSLRQRREERLAPGSELQLQIKALESSKRTIREGLHIAYIHGPWTLPLTSRAHVSFKSQESFPTVLTLMSVLASTCPQVVMH